MLVLDEVCVFRVRSRWAKTPANLLCLTTVADYNKFPLSVASFRAEINSAGIRRNAQQMTTIKWKDEKQCSTDD